jgi:hypothetical protein
LSGSRRLAAALAAWLAADSASGALRAEQIREETAAELLIGGPDAIGGVGDWYLANDLVEVIVDDPSRRFGKRNHGGVIVDAGLRDRRGEDQFAELFPLLNLDQRVELRFDRIRAEVDSPTSWARLVVSASRGPGVIARGGGSRPNTPSSPASPGCGSPPRSAIRAAAPRRSSPTETS